ncbi:ExbD/TolR family protein [Castellaniella defragrans]|jgi:biopolymer transport protein ExbD|uniref:Biopolymer transport protein ExbD/TolR n=2 Tax=Castellaniella defragrans TaxID=75697 RepID=W8WYE3_CASD6|nr:biopolymer transporter ExbD [Castellaniella defragrans]KAB0615979.1 biopolymer transporter ExbD [Castellaniella defragrans]MBB6082336.1 biopolymer transport protein ExbD [Castellaniella defragrans]CDM24758.1 Biopolymer transport protein ExbD/TolR [Castellaniella defragrans 65Phen]
MNFHHRRAHDEPEINLIPLIDVLLVILIFLAASTSFTRHRQLQVALPQAQAEAPDASPFLELAISRDGLYALDGHYVDATDDAALAESLRQAAAGRPDLALRIDADGQAAHAAVVRALEAARLAHIGKVHFLTQARP